jgi:hypothetical protein
MLDREVLIAALNAGSAPRILHMGHVVVPPEAAMGPTLLFGRQGNIGTG